jgi:hypothetical protein
MRLMIVVGLGLAGCGVGTESAGDDLPTAEAARAKFDTRAWPVLAKCTGCHAAQPAIDFLAPGTPDGAYTTLFGFQPSVLDLGSPSSSLLVSMGKHTGPAFLPAEAAAVLEWLAAERTARVTPAGEPTYVGPVTAETATVALPTSGTLQLVATPFPGGVAFSEVSITAGATALRVMHPVFVSHPPGGEPIVDELDRFGELDLEVAPGTTEAIGGAVFPMFSPEHPLTIHFRMLEAP